MNNAINVIFLVVLTVLTSVAVVIVATGIAVANEFNVPFVVFLTLYTIGYSIYTFLNILFSSTTK